MTKLWILPLLISTQLAHPTELAHTFNSPSFSGMGYSNHVLTLHQLAKQLTDSMFAEGSTCNVAGVICGSMPDLGGNTITWKLGDGSDQGMIVINITNNSNSLQTTTMKVPSGAFYF